MELLSDRVAVVTGGGRGMGRAEAELFADHGASVVLTDVDEENGEAVAEGIKATGGNARFVPQDVSAEAGWESLLRTVEDEYGRLDILVNNAGIIRSESVTDETVEGWQQVLNVDLQGVWLGMKHGIPLMTATGGGSVVNISSIWGLRGGTGVSAAYHAAKGGVTVLTKNAAVGYAGEGVRVNSIHPGYVRNPMREDADSGDRDEPEHGPPTEEIPQKRFAEVEEIAEAALFLASDMASYVNGVGLRVDGGFHAK
ncbi:SDR family NAD(P)-dependent oxidoreductase [Halogeometricum sp. CBA1124]|uniref:SDR family NAD(P)-dependent oxidoreductase n=1 Tax=Halogeometricum sp. CBA1124 TaxID=2668071 RepID=UPI00142B816B|nr:glucose 1-dehydrogenase [Halogeometricum sp. CBA1124]MUV56191.1 glucose 1-dehydrogenase [Halogeometricum sp. CBA1124]